MASKVILFLVTLFIAGGSSECQEGSTWTTGPENCGRWACLQGSAKRVSECRKYKLSSRCKILPIPNGTQYPLCCPQFECPPN